MIGPPIDFCSNILERWKKKACCLSAFTKKISIFKKLLVVYENKKLAKFNSNVYPY